MPISASALGGYGIKTKAFVSEDPTLDLSVSQKSSYFAQLLIARKFGSKVSLQVMPTFVHRNLVTDYESNDIFSLGFATQYQVLKNWSLSAEYYMVSASSLPEETDISGKYYSSLSLGFQIDTKGHVFQFHMSNSSGMMERHFITETNGDWLNGDIFVGFNITRDFKIKGRKIR